MLDARRVQLGRDLRLDAGLLQNVERNFLQPQLKFKHRLFASPAPSIDLPVRAHKFRLVHSAKVEQQGLFTAIELLRKADNRLGSPCRSVGRPIDADIKRFLFDHVRNFEAQQKDATLRARNIQGGSVALAVNDSFFTNQKSINHRPKILSEPGLGLVGREGSKIIVMSGQMPDLAASRDSIHVRLPNAADVPAMIAITNAAFAFETFLDGTRTDEERMAELMRAGEFLVAQDNGGNIVASVYIELRGERGYFGMLAVDPAQQGTGLGRRMTVAAEDHCRRHGCAWMDLSVLTLRPELPPLYRKLGYIETGREPFVPSRPLKDGMECECIIMSKAL